MNVRPAQAALSWQEPSLWWWIVLLLPLLALWPLPIDETRYLTVAWEMHLSGHWLVPTVNGAWYADKPPLLFWLIAGLWKVTGVHTWSARLLGLALTGGVLGLTGHLAQRLGYAREEVGKARWILAGSAFVTALAVAIMFDMLLTVCVLIAVLGLLDLSRGHTLRGIVLLALGLGLGILSKGPVVLLHVSGLIVLGPWWSEHVRAHPVRWYGAALLGMAGAAVIALLWALPAAAAGGPQYANAIFFHQTFDRMDESFAHARPVWWYLMVLPFLILPWTVGVRASTRRWKELPGSATGKFLLAWFVVPFVAFCLISGKQPHYLLPLLPALALALAWLLRHDDARVDARGYVPILLLLALAIIMIPFWAAHHWAIARSAGWAWLAFLPLLAAFALLRLRAWRHSVAALGLTSALGIVASLLCVTGVTRPLYDIAPIARQVHAFQQRGVPLAHVGWHNGLFGFTGRLHQPLPVIRKSQVLTWARAHPDGMIVTSQRSDRFTAPAIHMQAFRSHSMLGIWRARAISGAIGGESKTR